MRVLIFVVLEMASSSMPRCSRCLRSFSPKAPTAGSGGRPGFRPHRDAIIIGEGRGRCQMGLAFVSCALGGEGKLRRAKSETQVTQGRSREAINFFQCPN